MQKNRDFAYEKKAAQILNDILYITIASVSPEGKPWNTPVFSAFDPDLNFYWTSPKDSFHSRNIRNQPDVFLAIYDSNVAQGKGEAVYFEATASELYKREEILVARKLTQARKGEGADGPEGFEAEAPRRVYKATITKGWTNESEKLENGWYDYRVELDLRRLRGLL